ncbi:MAG: hypothetical protein AB1297_05380 [bacterium]
MKEEWISYQKKIEILAITIMIPLLVVFFLFFKDRFKEISLFLYTISANSFIPFPHEPVVIVYGSILNPLVVSIICGVATIFSAIIDLIVMGSLFKHKSVVEFKERNYWYKLAARYFNISPSGAMVFAAFTLIPFYPFRVMAILTGLAKWKYILSTFIGRTPRYYLLALMGDAFYIPLWAIVLLFFLMLIPPVLKVVKKANL